VMVASPAGRVGACNKHVWTFGAWRQVSQPVGWRPPKRCRCGLPRGARP
jgi:hypothetical protein